MLCRAPRRGDVSNHWQSTFVRRLCCARAMQVPRPVLEGGAHRCAVLLAAKCCSEAKCGIDWFMQLCKSTRSWNSLDWDWCRRTVEPLGRSVLHRHGGGHSRDMRAQPRAGAASNDSHSRSRGRPERPPQHRLRRRSCTRLHVAGLPPARPHYGRLRAAGFRQKWRSPPSVGHWIAWLRGC